MEEQYSYTEGIPTKEFYCSICQKYFSRKFTLDMHLLIHEGLKPHPCPFCGKCFRQKGTLIRHKALHSSSNLFHCSLCNRGFRQKNIFSHHLKHRHNVSTETLDRRKYRTELKDYQSIMDTLPSFVLADSTAIASSEKHLDAMLLESLQTNSHLIDGNSLSQNCDSVNSLTIIKEHSIKKMVPDSSNAFIESDNNNVLESECIESSHSFKYKCGQCFKSFPNYSLFTIHVEVEHNDSDVLIDSKPIVNHISDTESISSDTNGLINITGNHPNGTECNINQSESFSHSLTKVSSSSSDNTDFINDFHSCIPCEMKFSSEVEFQCHAKTHVQSALDADLVDCQPCQEHTSPTIVSMNTNAKVESRPKQSKLNLDSSKPVNISNVQNMHSFSVERSKQCETINLNAPETLDSKHSFHLGAEKVNILENSCFPISDYIQQSHHQRKNLLDENVSPIIRLLCPFCKKLCHSENDLFQHTKEHVNTMIEKYQMNLVSSLNSASNSNKNIYKNPQSFRNGRHSISSTNFNSFNKIKSQENFVSLTDKKHTVSKVSSKVKRKHEASSKIYICRKCPVIFKTEISYIYHKQMHLGNQRFRCHLCKITFAKKYLLLQHTRLTHVATYRCSKCSRVFQYPSIFKFHIQNCKSLSAVKKICDVNLIEDVHLLQKTNVSNVIGVIPIHSEVDEIGSNGIKVGIPLVALSNLSSDIKVFPMSCFSLMKS